ncbi:MAG: PorT family protein [Bacteroidota bacterium]|nr:PorT family protein [Bacteroidota bacterium]
MKTIKQIFVVVIFCSMFFVNNSFGQLKNFGIKGGLNLSNVNYEVIYDLYTENKIGFNVQIFYDFLNYTNVSLSAETGYSQKGFDFNYPITNEIGEAISSETIHTKLNYINTDILARFSLNSKTVNPYISIGPVVGFYTGYSISSSGPNDTLFQVNILLENLKSPAFGLILGAGTEFKNLMSATLIAEVRYNFDFTNSSDLGAVNFKNKVVEFNAGIIF